MRPTPRPITDHGQLRFYQKMRGVKIGTARDIVERSIGKPDLCGRKIYRGEYELQRCGYDLGDPETYQK